jgi:hypothetical protein
MGTRRSEPLVWGEGKGKDEERAVFVKASVRVDVQRERRKFRRERDERTM